MATCKYNCTDCGKPMSYPGTCNDCKVKDQPKEGKRGRP